MNRPASAPLTAFLEPDFRQWSELLRPDKADPSGILFSLIVPTRARPDGMRKLLDSITTYTSRPEEVEVVMVIDDDDDTSRQVNCDGLTVQVVGRPGRSMGELVTCGTNNARGRYIMLLNDDVSIETPGWDDAVRSVLRHQPDDILMIHVNDMIFGRHLCTFPIVSRTFCELSTGITDERYRRYCIDDAIFNIFNLLACLGHRRIIYLEDIVFRHENFALGANGAPVYTPIPEIRAEDVKVLKETQSLRNEAAIRLAAYIEAVDRSRLDQSRRDNLRFLDDVEALRRPELSRCLDGDAIDLEASITIAVICEDLRSQSVKMCLDALKAHTPETASIIVIDASKDDGYSAILNRLIVVAGSDYVFVVDESVRVRAGWLAQMIRHVAHDTAIVIADVGSIEGDLTSNMLLLLDPTKLASLRFDESFPFYLYDLDLRLRALELGLNTSVARCPAGVERNVGLRGKEKQAAFLHLEVSRWKSKWVDSGRLARLDPVVVSSISSAIDLVCFPIIVDKLLTLGDNRERGGAANARQRHELRSLAGRPRFARAFWSALDAEFWRRQALPQVRGIQDEQLLRLGGLGEASWSAAAAYRMRLKMKMRWRAITHLLGARVPPGIQREVGKMFCTFGLQSIGSSLWDHAAAVEHAHCQTKSL